MDNNKKQSNKIDKVLKEEMISLHYSQMQIHSLQALPQSKIRL